MQLNDFVAMMQGIAPNELSMGYDNVGLLIGPESKDIKKRACGARLLHDYR